jgi:hypothetical protein
MDWISLQVQGDGENFTCRNKDSISDQDASDALGPTSIIESVYTVVDDIQNFLQTFTKRPNSTETFCLY